MEYCVTVLVQSFNPDDEFRKPEPVRMAWGEAWRSEEYGKYFWGSDYYIAPSPPLPWLLRSLPQNYQEVNWIYLTLGSIGRNALYPDLHQHNDFEQPDAGLSNRQMQTLVRLFRKMLSDQSQWAVFVLRDCDQMEVTYRQSVNALCQTIKTLFDSGSEASRGFASISR